MPGWRYAEYRVRQRPELFRSDYRASGGRGRRVCCAGVVPIRLFGPTPDLFPMPGAGIVSEVGGPARSHL